MINLNLSYYAIVDAVEQLLIKELHIPSERLQGKNDSLIEVMVEFNDHVYKKGDDGNYMKDDNGELIVDEKAPKKKRYLHYGDDFELLVTIEEKE